MTTEILTHTETFTSCNILSATVGTNCPMGGDGGHGGRTFFGLYDEAGTYWCVKINGVMYEDIDSIEITLAGDCEADTFLDALKFAVEKLEATKTSGTPKLTKIEI